uniref:Sushi domain-containing protein n=1 Tax=Otus sunia TaxID=257818 RepID=A0A8C8AZ64_9STRI
MLVNKPCGLPHIENGKIAQYYYNFRSYYFPMRKAKKLSYSCTIGYTTVTGTQDGRITCTAEGWSPVPRCYSELALLISSLLPAGNFGFYHTCFYNNFKKSVHFPYFGKINRLSSILSNQTVSFHLEKCNKPLLENGFVYGTEIYFKIHEKLQYKCNPGYHTPSGGTEDTVQCQLEGWSSRPSCTKKFGRILHFSPL